MRRTNRMMTALATASLWLVLGCGGVQEGQQTTASHDEVAGFTLVPRQYPYTTSHGEDRALVCADWEKPADEGDGMDVKREWYPIDTMNRHLARIGTPDAVPHIDEGFRSALRERGVSRIETCEHARAYVALSAQRQGRAPLAELAGSDHYKSAAPTEQGLALPRDKIFRGRAVDHASTVGIRTAAGTCTGNLISSQAMITAAHCVPGTGAFPITAWVHVDGQVRSCITHPGLACPTQPGANNVLIVTHPDYDGTLGVDQAVIINGNGWRAPANTSARWTRFALNWGLPLRVALQGHSVQIAGYGANASTGGGAGVGRGGDAPFFIHHMNDQMNVFNLRREGGTTVTCGGDSGSGVHATRLLATNLLLGILHWHWAVLPGSGRCAVTANDMSYSVPDGPWISSVVRFFGGVCSEFTEATTGTPYPRCW